LIQVAREKCSHAFRTRRINERKSAAERQNDNNRDNDINAAFAPQYQNMNDLENVFEDGDPFDDDVGGFIGV
jgi:hypothetical protein